MIYLYQHPSSKQIIEVNQGMNDVHEYYDEEGLKWDRVFTVPNASIDTKLDPFSSRQFLDKTNKRGTMADLVDRSKELSEMRRDKVGYDPLQKKEVDKYKKRFKVKHPSEIKKI
jgi:hypothetical protein